MFKGVTFFLNIVCGTDRLVYRPQDFNVMVQIRIVKKSGTSQ